MSRYSSHLIKQKVPSLSQGTGVLNMDKFVENKIENKVVIIEFWTYGCYNCINTLPFMVKTHEEFKDQPVEFIGIHTPEFDYEKPLNNVKKAVEKYGIKYPVIQDNNFKIWNSFNNRWWPHFFIVDKKGIIRYNFVGEGHDKEIRNKINELLLEI